MGERPNRAAERFGGPALSRRKGTSAWLAKDFMAAADHFGEFASFYADGTPGRAMGLRLRAAALLRIRQFDEAQVTWLE